ncbi:hypothetical protein F5144DRAFT_641723 [Chaetomium tenue]|uniref:Uncharacterized protein n=1 Tax=Chaetomium tenue TaxID=1854479 RepID=A0ACB7PGZ1_9PEZI|nr:hypothetical protein F5144DRAFT_641723 [Chaetomium globosum]
MDATLTPKQKKRLHEVADLMLQIFHTLARMRYLEPEWIEPGPHDISALMPVYKFLNIDPAIIYLYSILPYLKDAAYKHGVDFFRGGEFVDFRDREDVEQGRNPMHDDEPESMMRPWMTPLSAVGNHSTALLYDAKLHVIGIYGQMDSGSSDPNLYEGAIFSTENEAGERIYFRKREDGTEERCDVSEWEKQQRNWDGNGSGDEEEEENDDDDDDENDGEDEEEDGDEEEDEEEEEEDVNHWDEMDARPAGNVLRDIIRWYHELFEIPGDGERTLDDFDGDAFLVDKMRAEAVKSVKEDAEEPLQQLGSLKAQLEWDKKNEESVMPQRLEKLTTATTVDEEWVVRWEIWQAERTTRDLQSRLKELERSIDAGGGRLVAEDLPLLELKHVEKKFLQTKHRLEQRKQAALDPQNQDEIRSLEKELAIYEKAYTASLADAERLCPGKPPLELDPVERTSGLNLRTRSEELAKRMADGERSMSEVQLWMAQLPDGAVKARRLAESVAEGLKGDIEWCSKTRQNCLDELEKHSRESSG